MTDSELLTMDPNSSSDYSNFGYIENGFNHNYNNTTFPETDYCFLAANYSYLNISCGAELSYSLPMYGLCTPILLLITMTANSLIVIVLSRRNMTSPTNMVLMGEIFCYLYICFVLLYYIYVFLSSWYEF